MKKFLWIAALIAALALIFAGCGKGAKGEDEDEKGKGNDLENDMRGVPIDGTEAWWVAPNELGTRKYPNNKVAVIGGEDENASYIHIFFTPPVIANNISDLQFGIEITLEFEGIYDAIGIDCMWQCGFDPYGTWARSSTADDYIDCIFPNEERKIKCLPAQVFPGSNWNTDKAALYPDKKKLTLREMKGLCIQIGNLEKGFEYGEVLIKDVKFSNEGPGPAITGPNPPAK